MEALLRHRQDSPSSSAAFWFGRLKNYILWVVFSAGDSDAFFFFPKQHLFCDYVLGGVVLMGTWAQRAAALARAFKCFKIRVFNNAESTAQVCACTAPCLKKVFPLFFRERATFLFGVWNHWLQHAPHLYLPEADEAAGDEFAGTGEPCSGRSAVRGGSGLLPALTGRRQGLLLGTSVLGGRFWKRPVCPGGSGSGCECWRVAVGRAPRLSSSGSVCCGVTSVERSGDGADEVMAYNNLCVL